MNNRWYLETSKAYKIFNRKYTNSTKLWNITDHLPKRADNMTHLTWWQISSFQWANTDILWPVQCIELEYLPLLDSYHPCQLLTILFLYHLLASIDFICCWYVSCSCYTLATVAGEKLCTIFTCVTSFWPQPSFCSQMIFVFYVCHSYTVSPPIDCHI